MERIFFYSPLAAALLAGACAVPADDTGDDSAPRVEIRIADARPGYYDAATATLIYPDGTRVGAALDLDHPTVAAPTGRALVEVALSWRGAPAGDGSAIAEVAAGGAVEVAIGRRAIAFAGGHATAPIAVRDGDAALIEVALDSGELPPAPFAPCAHDGFTGCAEWPVSWVGLGSIEIPTGDAEVAVPVLGTWGEPTLAYADRVSELLTVFGDGRMAPIPDDPELLEAAGIPTALLAVANTALVELGDDPAFRGLAPADALFQAGGVLALTLRNPRASTPAPTGFAVLRRMMVEAFLSLQELAYYNCGLHDGACDDPAVKAAIDAAYDFIEGVLARIRAVDAQLLRDRVAAELDGDTERARRIQNARDELRAIELELMKVSSALLAAKFHGQ